MKPWDFLKGKFEAGNLAHAYLFSGPGEVEKTQATSQFIKLLHCAGEKKPCTQCFHCALIEKQAHPDVHMVASINSKSSIENQKDMMEIDVVQIRQVNDFLSYKSYYGGYKSVIIVDAERMNTEAQNSFLKTLEEPKGQTMMILASSKPELLLPTIFSRCQTVRFLNNAADEPGTQPVHEILKVISLDLAEKFQYAKKVNLDGNHFQEILGALQTYFRQMLLGKIGALQNPPKSAKEYSIEKLKKIMRLIESLSFQLSTTNASPKLALEVLLMEI